MRGYEKKQQGSHSAAWSWLQIQIQIHGHCAPTSCASRTPSPFPRSLARMPLTCVLHRYIVITAVSYLPLVHGIAVVLSGRHLLLLRFLLLDGETPGRNGLGPGGQRWRRADGHCLCPCGSWGGPGQGEEEGRGAVGGEQSAAAKLRTLLRTQMEAP